MIRPLTALTAVLISLSIPGAARGGVPEHPSVSVGPEPSWVVVGEVARLDVDGESGAVKPSLRYLEFDHQILIGARTAEEYFRDTIRVEAAAGLGDASQFEIDFDPSFSTVTIHRLRVFRDGAWHDRIDEAFVTIAQREADFARRLYDGSLSILLVLDDIRVGDVISLSYTVLGTNPVFGDRYFQEIRMGWSEPVDWRRVRVLCPKTRPLDWRTYGEVEVHASQSSHPDLDEYTWLQEGAPAVRVESWTPDDWDDSPWLQLTQYPSWSEVVGWALPLYLANAPDSADVAAVVSEVVAGAGTPEERVTKLIRWVQDDVRYFGVELGAFSHEPHPPADTIRRRYGDCKDKSLLLIALLREIGIEAWPVLIDTWMGAALPQRLPSPGVFDHVIVVARMDGGDLWIDPTISLQGGPLAELWVPDYGWGLIVRPGETGLTKVGPSRGGRGTIAATYHYDFAADGNACEVTIETTYAGRQAETMRHRLAGSTMAELQDAFARHYSIGNSRAVPIADLEITDERETNRFRLVERYRLENWWYREDETEYFDLLPLLMQDIVTPSDDRDRRAPMQTPPTVRHSERVVISPPELWELEPVEASVETPWFSYRIDGARSGAVLTLDYEFETTGAIVSAGDITAFNEAADRLAEDLYYSIFRSVGGSTAGGAGRGPFAPPVWAAMSAAAIASLLIVGAVFWALGRVRFL